MSQVKTVTSAADLEKRPEWMITFFRCVTQCPPHGPYASLCSLVIHEGLLREHQIEVPVAAITSLIRDYFNTDHLRHWPSFYMASELQNPSFALQ